MDWYKISQIGVPALLVITGWDISLWIQSNTSKRSLKDRTYLDASWEMRKSIDEMIGANKPFLAKLMVLDKVVELTIRTGSFPNEIQSGWIKKKSWDDFINEMSEDASQFGLASKSIIDTISKYDYLHDFDWRKFSKEIQSEIDTIDEESRAVTTGVIELLNTSTIPNDGFVARCREISSKSNKLVYRVKKQSEAIEKAMARFALHVKDKDMLHIDAVGEVKDFMREDI